MVIGGRPDARLRERGSNAGAVQSHMSRCRLSSVGPRVGALRTVRGEY